MVLCYNRGCGQKFDLNDESKSCLYHPGVPVFHDAYKGWSCCSKKTTDFTEFLNIKGCTEASHSNVKPPEPPKPENGEVDPEPVEIRKPLESIKRIERPSEDAAMISLKAVVGSSLRSKLDALKAKSADSEKEVADANNGNLVAVGTSCKNGGCRKTYENESDNRDTCMHHPGAPIFHEGLKYWTCCLRKTSDFNSFLNQIGCTASKHLWIKAKNSQETRQNCRYDWYQTAPYVFVSVYAKMPIPEESQISANQVKLRIFITFDEDRNTFDLDLTLVGIINVQSSEVTYSPSKVEIKLKKAEPMTWSKLALPPPVNVTDDTELKEVVELSTLSLS